MTEFVETAAGDRVAFDRYGDGPIVIFVAGAGPWREIDFTTTETAELLGHYGVKAVVYDRLGRGESMVAGPLGLEREMLALAALIEAVDSAGDGVVLCGHSSGGSLALYAAASGLPVAGLALWETPLAPPNGGSRELADSLRGLIGDNDLEGALNLYMADMPPEILEIVKSIPAMIDQAGSLQADADSLAWAESASLAELFTPIRVPVIALVGEQSYDEVMVPAAESIVAAIPGAEWKRVPGAQHEWEPASMASELANFVGRIWS
ncbi:alpha/beta fold hydrolase [Salinibacterium sp. PAMC 21357]|uniref:alpha/beta fold hydrolase n=1 Tax=Salinibacterium sp. PAMC 21357 TaxID=1112215 RepID=UPI0002892BD2|nr:alpha/beta hydrolase [Salinibacterium sp. PAMC 21357]